MPPFNEEDLPNNGFDDSHREVPNPGELATAMDTPDPRNRPMSEIAMHLEYKATRALSDFGSRFQHLSDLMVHWEDAVEMMNRRNFLGRDELFKKAGIELAIKQLRKTIESMQDYGEFVNPVRKLVDQVPKAFAIYGGRGTPIKPWQPDVNEEII